MADIKFELLNSVHFYQFSRLAQFRETEPIRHVYKQLAARGEGSFILLADHEEALGYVRAHELANHLLGQVSSSHSLGSLLEQPVGRIVRPALGTSVVVPVWPDDIDIGAAIADLQNRPDMVYRVAQAKRMLGWFLNHEGVLDAFTRKTVFICARGHRNPDPDSGRCYQCPARIVRTERE